MLKNHWMHEIRPVVLLKKEKIAKEAFELKKMVLQSCGIEIAKRERHQQSLSMGDEDIDSGE